MKKTTKTTSYKYDEKGKIIETIETIVEKDCEDDTCTTFNFVSDVGNFDVKSFLNDLNSHLSRRFK